MRLKQFKRNLNGSLIRLGGSYSSNHIGNEGGDTGGHGYPQL